jgi:MFS family permease
MAVKKRYQVLALLSSLSLITYMDRLCIAVAGPAMQKDLGLDAEDWGWVLGAFALTYSLFEIPAGAWGDRFGQKNILTRIVLWWSAFTALTGFVSKLPLLILVRALFGAGEAGAYPNMSGVVRRWFPFRQRSRAMGVIWGASRLGGALAPLIIVPIITLLGWRQGFWLFGSLGIGWVLWWRKKFHNDPGDDSRIADAELKEIAAADGGEDQNAGQDRDVGQHHGARQDQHAGQDQHAVPWKTIFSQPQVWLIMGMCWCYVWGSWFYLSWFHTYLVKGRGFTMTEMGFYAPLPFIMGIIGNAAGGYLSDKCATKFGIRTGRRLIGVISLASSAACLFLTAATTGKTSGMIFLILGFGLMDGMLPVAWSICLDIGGKYAGVVSGAMNAAGNLGGFVCSIVFGYLVQRSGQYTGAITMVGMLLTASAILFAFIDPEKKITYPINTQHSLKFKIKNVYGNH